MMDLHDPFKAPPPRMTEGAGFLRHRGLLETITAAGKEGARDAPERRETRFARHCELLEAVARSAEASVQGS